MARSQGQRVFMLRAALAAVLFVVAATLIADTEVLDPNSYQLGTKVIKSGALTLSNGVINQSILFNFSGKMYVTQNGCVFYSGCKNELTMTFDRPVKNLKFTVAQGDVYPWLKFSDDAGHSFPASLGCPDCNPNVGPRLTNPATIEWPWNDITKLTIVDTDNAPFGATYWNFGVFAISYDVGPPNGLVVRLGDNPNAANEPAPVVVSSGMKANIPLGRVFSIRFKRKVKNVWQTLPASFELGTGHVQGGPAHPDQTLYPNDPIFMYGDAPDSATRLFQSLHLGTVPLTITPTDTTLPKVVLTLNSIEPASLGAAGSGNVTNYDGHFWEQGSIRGIPPQYVKAVAYHESDHTYGAHTWRYEPEADKKYVAPDRGRAPWSDYRLPSPASDSGYTLGRWLCPKFVNSGCGFSDVDDLQPNSVLRYSRGGVDNNPYLPYSVNVAVTIREICNGKQSARQNWPCPPALPSPPPPIPGKHKAVSPAPVPSDPWSAVANPHLAASYGMFQVTWYSNPSRHFWDGTTPLGGSGLRQNPAMLFDDPANIARGSASIISGPNELRWAFWQNNAFGTVTPAFNTPADLEAGMWNALGRYNGDESGYPPLVLQYVPRFLGVLPANVAILEASCSASPTIESVTSGAAIVPGGTTTLSVASTDATGYQWYQGAAGDTAHPILNGDQPSIDVSPSTTTAYWVRASNTCGSTDQQVTVTVGSDCAVPQFTALPADQTVPRGSALTLSAAASATDAFQWYQAPDGGLVAAVPGGNVASVVVHPQENMIYIVSAANACQVTYSRFIHVAVTPCDAAAITQQPSDLSVVSGQSATLSVAVAGTAPVQVQWFTAGGAPAGSGASIQVTPFSTTSYVARVSNACGSADSNPVTVTVTSACVPAVVVSTPQPATIIEGHSAVLALGVGGTSPLAVQWYTAAGAAAGAAGFVTVTPSSTTTYYAVVSNACGSATSGTVTVTVIPLSTCTPTILAQPSGGTILPGDSITLSVNATASMPLSYQWFASASGGAWQPLVGETARTLTVAPNQTTYYYVRVSNDCAAVESATVTVTVTPPCLPPSITSQPASASVAPPGSVTLRVSAEGSGTLAYQWLASLDGILYAPIPAETASELTVSPTTSASYVVRVTNACGTTESTPAFVEVITGCVSPAITQDPSSQSVQAGASASLSVQASGTALTYQWYQGDTLGTWTAIPSGTAARLDVTTQATTYYYVHVANACGSADSAYAVVTVVSQPPSCTSPPVISAIQPSSASIQVGSSVTLFVSSRGGVTYQWYESTAGGPYQPMNGEIINGGAASTVTVSPTTTSYYFVRVGNACGSVDSSIVQVTVTPVCDQPGVVDMTSVVHFMPGDPVTIHVVAVGTNLRYQWYKSEPAGSPMQPIYGATSDTVVDIPNAPEVMYQVLVSNDCGTVPSPYAWALSLTECIAPTFETLGPIDQTITLGQTATMSATVHAQTPVTWQWYESSLSTLYWVPVANATSTGTSSSITVGPSQDALYYVEARTDCGAATGNTLLVRVVQP